MAAAAASNWPPPLNVMAALRLLPLLLVLIHLEGHQGAQTPSASSLFRRQSRRFDDELGQLCKRAGGFKKISQMEELNEALKRTLAGDQQPLDAAQSPQQQQPSAQTSCPSPSCSFKLFGPHPALACIQQADAIMDLVELLRERENVCSSTHLDKLESYFERYVKPHARMTTSGSGGVESSSESIASGHFSTLATSIVLSHGKLVTGKFFKLYANQVSFTCKSGLLFALNTIEKNQLVDEVDYVQALPWSAFTNSKICKEVEQQERLKAGMDAKQQQVFAEGPNSHSAAIVQQCKAGRALSEISNIQELVEALGGVRQRSAKPSSVAVEEGSSLEVKPHVAAKRSGLFLIVQPDQLELVEEMLIGCAKMQPIYEQTVLPIVRLVHLGFNPAFPNFDKVCTEDKLIQKWFAVTLVCNSILSSHLTNIDKYKELREEFEAKNKSLVVVDEEESVALPLGEAQRKEAASNQVLSLLKNPIEDELWVYKYGTTKLQRFKEGVIKRIFKLFRVEDIDDHIVFRKTVEGVNHWIVKVVILTVSLLILSSLHASP